MKPKISKKLEQICKGFESRSRPGLNLYMYLFGRVYDTCINPKEADFLDIGGGHFYNDRFNAKPGIHVVYQKDEKREKYIAEHIKLLRPIDYCI